MHQKSVNRPAKLYNKYTVCNINRVNSKQRNLQKVISLSLFHQHTLLLSLFTASLLSSFEGIFVALKGSPLPECWGFFPSVLPTIFPHLIGNNNICYWNYISGNVFLSFTTTTTPNCAFDPWKIWGVFYTFLSLPTWKNRFYTSCVNLHMQTCI